MLIECLIKRDGGSLVELPGANGAIRRYHFVPEIVGGPHLCEVSDKVDASVLLAITDGYRQVKPVKDATPPAGKPEEAKPNADV